MGGNEGAKKGIHGTKGLYEMIGSGDGIDEIAEREREEGEREEREREERERYEKEREDREQEEREREEREKEVEDELLGML